MSQALPYVGAAIGFAIGGPTGAQIGFMAGSLTAGIVDPQRTEGPRVQDLRVQTATYGRPLPVIFGTERIAGNIVWAKPLKEVEHEERAGKGGPVTTTYSYYANAAIAICEGPIAGIRRIWADGKIFYNSSATSTTVTTAGSSPLTPLTSGDPSNSIPSTPTSQSPTINDPFKWVDGSWTFDNPSQSDEVDSSSAASDNYYWSTTYHPDDPPFRGEQAVRDAIHQFYSRRNATIPQNYIFTYLNADTVVISNIDNVYNGGENAVSVTFRVTRLGIPECGNGYEYNAATDSCDPIFESGGDSGTYIALSGGGTTFGTRTVVNGDVVLTPNITVYRGTEDQLPDANIESDLGVNNVPAYRGTAYIVLNDFPVDAYGNRLPNFEFEVVSSGNTSNITRAIVGPQGGYGTTGFAYDEQRGALWSLMLGDGSGPDYTRLNVDAGTKVAGMLSGPGAGDFKTLGFTRYDAATDSLWIVGVKNGAVCFAKVAPDAGIVLQVLTPSIPLPTAIAGFCINPDLGQLLVSGRSGAGVFGIYAVDMSTGVAVAVATIDDGSTAAVYAINGNVNSLEYVKATGAVWAGYKATPAAGGATAFKIAAYNATTHQKLRDVASSGPSWFLAEPSTGNTWIFEGSALLLFNRATGSTSHSTSAGITGATTDGSGNIGVVVEGAANGNTVASFDAAGVFTGHVITATAGLFNPGYDVFSDSSRGLLAASTGTVLANRFSDGSVTVGDVFKNIAARVRVSAQSIDVSDVEGADCIVQGFGINNRTPARSAFEPMVQAYGLDVVASGSKIRVQRRANAPYYGVIPWADQGAHQDTGGNDYVAPLSSVRSHDMELPSTVEVAFDDPVLEYRKNIRRAQKDADGSSVDAQVISLPIVMSTARAQAVADTMLATQWLGRSTFELTVGIKHIAIDPGDVADIDNGDGTLTRVIINRVSFSPTGLIKLSATAFDYSTYSSLATVPVAAPVVSTGLAGGTKPRLMLLDIPLLTSADDGSGFYAVSYGLSGGSDVFVSSDAANYVHLTTLTRAGTAGFATSALPAFGSSLDIDYVHSINVVLSSGSLYSATSAEIVAGANTLLVGQEILQFVASTREENGSYTLSQLRRGKKGTRPATVHAAGERVVLLNGAVQRVVAPLESNGVTRYYKIVAPGQSLDTAPAIQFANTDNGLKPLSPSALVASRNGAGDLAMSWTRRSRISETSIGSFLPLGESAESYQIEILDEAGSVKRTMNSFTASTTYTAANQVSDFDSNQAAVRIRIYQMSSTIGRGTPLDITA